MRLLGLFALLAGAAIAMAGAALPWLTIYAGLYQYSGLTGLYGWVTFGIGALLFAGSVAPLRGKSWFNDAALLAGVVLVLFDMWLYAGLKEILDRPDSAMLVARAGPGLFVIFGGGALIMLGAALRLWAVPRPMVARQRGPMI
jgi:hypothetical protein